MNFILTLHLFCKVYHYFSQNLFYIPHDKWPLNSPPPSPPKEFSLLKFLLLNFIRSIFNACFMSIILTNYFLWLKLCYLNYATKMLPFQQILKHTTRHLYLIKGVSGNSPISRVLSCSTMAGDILLLLCFGEMFIWQKR